LTQVIHAYYNPAFTAVNLGLKVGEWMTAPVLFDSAHRLARGLAAREWGSEELVAAFLGRVRALEPRIGAFLTLQEEQALKQARVLDEARVRGEVLGALAGIPMALKDNVVTRGLRTTCASRLLENFHPTYTATAVERLLADGLVLMGKTNMDEFGMGSSTENSAYQVTANPWDLARVPGGSSGGSAAAVAAGMSCVAIGSDTGGSIRQPAAFCGLVGIKPTYGLVSRYGLVAYASSLDQIGPITRDVRDNAMLLDCLAAQDPRDATSLPTARRLNSERCQSALGRDVKGLRLGIVRELNGSGVDSAIRDSLARAVQFFEAAGMCVEEVSLPRLDVALATYYVLAMAEASSNLARYDGVRYGIRARDAATLTDMYRSTRAGFGAEVKRRIMLGTYVLAAGYHDAYYKKAQQVRALLRDDFETVFTRFDVLITPTTPGTAFRLGERVNDPLRMYLADIATIPVNLAGLPALSFPAGFDPEGMPIGLQLIGPALSEPLLYQVAYAYEQAHDWVQRHPVL
jgi:aspartyl-tRNA(Asn)/glutamyl-tRNA(Gln) amidotransferase subunit A